jgi:predicted TIM-barrel fold metal-dependent hydrolase
VVTPQDPDAAAAEIRRAASANPRFVSVLLPVRAAVGYGARRYWPVWETALEYDLPIALTYGGSPGTPPSPVGWLDSSFEEYGSATSHYQAQVASLVMSGVFEKLPELRVVLLESGWTWLPSLFWRMDREWKGLRREVPWMTDLPSAYARKHFRLTTSPTDAPESRTYVDELVDQLGSAEILMFGSDYPHHYPAEDEFLARITSAGIADEVMWANAERCFPRISRAV